MHQNTALLRFRTPEAAYDAGAAMIMPALGVDASVVIERGDKRIAMADRAVGKLLATSQIERDPAQMCRGCHGPESLMLMGIMPTTGLMQPDPHQGWGTAKGLS
jgi:hypothetical protein